MPYYLQSYKIQFCYIILMLDDKICGYDIRLLNAVNCHYRYYLLRSTGNGGKRKLFKYKYILSYAVVFEGR